jgi:hypothetical protein
MFFNGTMKEKKGSAECCRLAVHNLQGQFENGYKNIILDIFKGTPSPV